METNLILPDSISQELEPTDVYVMYPPSFVGIKESRLQLQEIARNLIRQKGDMENMAKGIHGPYPSQVKITYPSLKEIDSQLNSVQQRIRDLVKKEDSFLRSTKNQTN
jgi:hypothetical protein